MTNPAYRVLVSDTAWRMLDNHIAFLANISESAAWVLRNDLLSRIKTLGETPLLYPVYVSGQTETEYRKLIYKRYLVLYSVDETKKLVRIKYVWDTRMDNSV